MILNLQQFIVFENHNNFHKYVQSLSLNPENLKLEKN